MPRFSRTLSSTTTLAAPPPEAVALESDFVVILAALLCALICVVGLIAAARCACRRRVISIGGGGVTGSPSQPSANKGLKKKVLQSLPKFTYTASASAGGTSEDAETSGDGDGCKDQVKVSTLSTDCVICLGEFVEGDEIRVLPQCGHGFHVACIDTWLGSHSSCPSCRQILVVGRCQKCGQYPAVSMSGGGGGCGAAAEARLKARQDRRSNVNVNNNNDNDAFLP